MAGKNRGFRDIALIAMVALLFLGLALLSASLISGESRRSRILVEYEADRMAAGLVESFRSQGGRLDPSLLDPRVLGFGIYGPDGLLAAGFGDAPSSMDGRDDSKPFRYDEGRHALILARPLGMGPARGGMPGLMKRMGKRLRGPGGLLYLSIAIGDFYRTSLRYRTASLLVPVFIAGLAAVFIALLMSNFRFRRRALEQETLARLGESARTLAHEIRNPLGAIRIQTGLLRKRMRGEEAKELDAIEEETERLNVLTRRVGDFLRNPLGRPESIDLPDFLRDLAGRLPYPLALARELPGLRVHFDRELLRSVIENLVRNAHESYGEGQEGGEVELSLGREGARVVVAVSDRGAGIAQGLGEKVFDPFYTSKTQGSGIGLPLARRFVEAAGGSLELKPREGGGTVAKVSLPDGGAA